MFTASSGMVNWVHTIHLKKFSTNIYYRIAGNFWGSKLSQISWFCGYLRKFSRKIWRCDILWRSKNKQSTKFSPLKSYFSLIRNSFLPWKFPLYTVFSTMSERNPLYGTIIHLSQRLHLTKWVLSTLLHSLGGNGIREFGGSALADALRVNQCLKTLK